MVSVRNYFRPVIITALGLVLTTSACSSNGDSPDTTSSATPSATATSTPSPSSSASGDSDDSAAAGNGKQVGVPAERSGTPDVITLEPDARAVSDLTESDPGANSCSTPTDGFRVYPPNNKAAVFVKQAGQACADDEPLLTVEPVHPA